jgi:pseudouridine-5'-phosphate glycosidase
MLLLRPEIESALRHHLPVVALESTLIAHGLPLATLYLAHRAGIRVFATSGFEFGSVAQGPACGYDDVY